MNDKDNGKSLMKKRFRNIENMQCKQLTLFLSCELQGTQKKLEFFQKNNGYTTFQVKRGKKRFVLNSVNRKIKINVVFNLY